MKRELTIPELIVEKVISEGGCLHTSFSACRFERYVGEDKDGEPVFGRFEPSQDLKTIISRNVVELRSYLERHRVAWCRQNGVEP